MSTNELRRAAKASLKQLPAEKLKVAVEFLAYLNTHASQEATDELLAIPGILDDLKQARAESASGQGVNWRSVRTDV